MKQMNRLKVIGLTGGIATGKSTVSKYLTEKSYPVIDADKIARNVVRIGQPSYKNIIDNFGTSILKKNGEINRRKLGDIVFNDVNKLKTLNEITHPFIFEDILKEVEELKNNESIIFIDIPLLIENLDKIKNYRINIDEIWLIYSSRDKQIKRIIRRDGIDRKGAIKRIDAQLSLEYKKKKADKIIINNTTTKKLKEQIDKLLDNLAT